MQPNTKFDNVFLIFFLFSESAFDFQIFLIDTVTGGKTCEKKEEEEEEDKKKKEEKEKRILKEKRE